jgi:LacI family transcriptional regulator, gluconate utilization system Gnt-I transcriptional repressor
MTVSRALRSGKRVFDNMRDRTVDVAKRRGYVPNPLATAFGADRCSTLVAMGAPRLTTDLRGDVRDDVDRALSRLGEPLMIGAHNHCPKEDEARIREVTASCPAGLILSALTPTPGPIDRLRSLLAPVVEIWAVTTSPTVMSVGFSCVDCSAKMGQVLLRRRRQWARYVGAQSRAAVMGAGRRDSFQATRARVGHPLVAREILHDVPRVFAGVYGRETQRTR